MLNTGRARLTIRQAGEADFDFVARNLREADIIEVTAAHNDSADKIIRGAGRWGGWKKVVVVAGRPAVLFGCTPGPDFGAPWMVATNDILRIRRSFILRSKHEVARMRRDYARLMNLVHRDNALSIKWLEWLGFHVDHRPAGNGGQFFLFSWRQDGGRNAE